MASDDKSKISVKFDDNLQLDVNAATLELLQRRIESQVMSSILRMFGIPVAGGGVFAVVIAALFWIPSQIKSVIEDGALVKTYVAAAVEKYLGDDKQGRPFISDQIELSLANYFVAGKGKDEVAKLIQARFADPEFKTDLGAMVNQQTELSVEKYFVEGKGTSEVAKLIQAQLTDDKIREVLTAAINAELRGMDVNRTGPISDNLQKHVATTTEVVDPTDKASFGVLERFLNRPETKQAGELGRPFILGFHVGRSDYYQPSAIDNQVQKIKATYPKSAVYFLLKRQTEGTFVALAGPVTPVPDGADRSKRLITMLEKPWTDLATAQAEVRSLNIFPTIITAQLPDLVPLETAMRTSVWSHPDKLDEKVAVVNAKQQFMGTTTRGQIIEALLKKG